MKLLWTLCALLVPTAVSVTPRFEPSRGLEVQKTFETSTLLEFTEMTSRFNGDDVPPEFLPEMDMHFETNTALVVHDRYEKVSDGRPERVVRHYDTIEESLEMAVMVTGIVDESGEYDGETEMAGKSVVFDWDGDDVAMRFADDDGDESLLEGLRGDLDFCSFLPKKDVEVGDSWELEPELFAAVIRPGGDLSIDGLVDPGQADRGEPTYTGSWKATILGEEASHLRIAIRGYITEAYEYETGLEHIPVADGTATETVTVEYDVEGELVWNLTAGHVHAASLSGEMMSTTVTTKDAGQPGPDFSSTLMMMGEWSADVAVEAAP